MKLVPFIWAGLSVLLAVGGALVESAKTADSIKALSSTPRLLQHFKSSNSSLLGESSVRRVKRGHGRSYTTALAYSRINDSGQGRRGGGGGHGGHGEGRGRRNPIGEDGSHIGDFKSHGVGYEHHHSGQCEESKCGYNIRHCPHGCVFNSFTCGERGAAYDTCCC